jgi:hypothetical protein
MYLQQVEDDMLRYVSLECCISECENLPGSSLLRFGGQYGSSFRIRRLEIRLYCEWMVNGRRGAMITKLDPGLT